MNEISKYSVVLTNPEGLDPVVLAKALAVARKTPVQDQIRPAKSAWGILAENVDEAPATSLVRSLSDLGIVAKVIPASSLAPLPEAKPLIRMEPEVGREIILIAAAAISVTSTTTTMVKEGPSAAQKILSTAILLGTGLPIKIGGGERTVRKTQENYDRLFYLDLISRDPLRRLRVDAQRFDYSFLKERKLYQVFGNFKLLIGDMIRSASQAWINRGTKVLMAGTPIQSMGYDSLADLERETRWLLTLQDSAAGRTP